MPETLRSSAGQPVLESGDHLSREEFHRLYCARPDIKKAELVEGVVFVAPSVSLRHAKPHAKVMAWLGLYTSYHPDVQFADNATVILDNRNEVQPDGLLWRDDQVGLPPDSKYFEGAPPLVVEVAHSSASYDLHTKREAYRRNGVREYLVWRVRDEMIDWFRLRDGQYEWVEPDEDGIIESTEFPGLRLSVPKLVAGDLAGVLAELDRDSG